MTALRRSSPADHFHRLFAAGSAALVLALAIFAASPTAHEWLHASDTGGDDQCAVVLFASGVSLDVAVPVVLPPRETARAADVARAERLFLVAPRYLRQPERGPPAA